MKILIIGCGYIGTELALTWSKSSKHEITAATRSVEKQKLLNNVVKSCVLFQENDLSQMQLLLNNNDIIIFTISSNFSYRYDDSYLKIANLIKQAAQTIQEPKTLIFTSSGAIYGDHFGKWVDETTPLNAQTDVSKLLLDIEQMFLSLKSLKWNLCILRLAQIYGPERELMRMIAMQHGHVLPGVGSNYANMVHLSDVLNAIDYVIEHRLEGTYNLVNEDHPTQKELYDKICSSEHIEKLQWNPENEPKLQNGNKRLSNHKIKSMGYVFLHPYTTIN